jgi:hypothetical protein
MGTRYEGTIGTMGTRVPGYKGTRVQGYIIHMKIQENIWENGCLEEHMKSIVKNTNLRESALGQFDNRIVYIVLQKTN